MTTTTLSNPPAQVPPVPPYAADEGLRATLRMAQWRNAVLEVQSAILSGMDVDTVLNAVAELARGLGKADVATVASPQVPGTSLVLRAAAGYRADDLRGAIFPLEESLSGVVLRTAVAMRVQDAASHDNAYQPICELGDMGPALLLPLERGAAPFGTLLVARRRGQPDFDDEEFELLKLFASQVSVAVEFCRSQEQLQRLATVEESERVSRDLHDTVIQRLFAIGLRLQALSAKERGAVSDPLQSVLDDLDETVREIRTTVLDPHGR